MYCPKCGREIPDNSKYCGVCGAKVEQIDSEKLLKMERIKSISTLRINQY